jgi:hypothetical protein
MPKKFGTSLFICSWSENETCSVSFSQRSEGVEVGQKMASGMEASSSISVHEEVNFQ